MRLRDLQRAVCREFGVTEGDLIAVTRLPNKVVARQVGFYLAHMMLKKTHREIGQHFVRDHTTVGFGIRQVRRDMRRNKQFGERIAKLTRRIMSGAK